MHIVWAESCGDERITHNTWVFFLRCVSIFFDGSIG